jgi:hypothetical protein
VLETKFTRRAYQSLSPWNKGWSRSQASGLRCDSAVIRRSIRGLLAEHDTPHRSNRSDYFREYATLVGEYTRRSLTEPGDILGAFMGILCKFGTKLSISTDIHFHGLLNSLDHSSLMEKALLWIPSQATALRRRCIRSHRSTVANRQFPSWAWSGWVGAVDYLIQESLSSDWIFSPGKHHSSSICKQVDTTCAAIFAPKTGSLHIRMSFRWSRRGDRRIIARLLETEEIHVNTPEERIDARALCVLTLFTRVAKVKRLTEQLGFVGQNIQTWMHRPFWKIHSTLGNRSDCAAILLDSGTRPLENEYRIACIGKGRRERPVRTTQGMRAVVKSEWVIFCSSKKQAATSVLD